MLNYRCTNLAVACVLAVFGVGCHAARNKPIVDPILSEMLGKDQESEEVKRFVKEMGEAPQREPHTGRSSFEWHWYPKGIRIVFGEDGKVGTILLLVRQPRTKNPSGYYKGQLPGGVDRDDDRKTVESKIGKADFQENFGGQIIDCYERTGLRIRYDSSGIIEMIIVRPEDLRKK
jgi:hypothetical protein